MATLRGEPLTEAPRGLRLREADKLECLAGGFTSDEAIAYSVKHSLRSEAVFAGDELLGIWGYCPSSILGTGVMAWMLTLPAADNHKIAIGRATLRGVAALLEAFPAIYVSVDDRHTLALEWLSWLGFRCVRRRPGFCDLVKDRN